MSVTWGAPAPESVPSTQQPENIGVAGNPELRPIPERPVRADQTEAARIEQNQSQEATSNNTQKSATRSNGEILFELNQAFPKVGSTDLAVTWLGIFNILTFEPKN